MKNALDLAAGVPWLITEEGLRQVLAIAAREDLDLDAAAAKLGEREAKPEAVAMRGMAPLEGTRRGFVQGRVAVLPVTGPIFRYANLFTAFSGATATGVLATDFTAAVESPNVDAIVLSLDSPGGVATGIAELAASIAAARSTKPIVAYVGDMGASAAYWIASAAGEIVLSETGFVGSIGARMAYRDTSQRDAAAGIRNIDIVSSRAPRKGLDPASSDGQAAIIAMLDALEERFIAAVAANRGVSVDTVVKDFGQGGMIPRAEDAVRLGMADRIGTLEQVIRELAAGGSKRSSTHRAAAAALPSKGEPMDPKTEAAPAALTVDIVKTNHPGVAAALVAEGREEAVTAERERIAKITARTLPGHAALRDKAVAEGTSYADFLEAQTAAEQEKGANKLAALRKDEAETGKVEAAPVATGADPKQPDAAADKDLPIEERAKAAWDKSPQLRTEFGGEFGRYLAFAKAEEAGQVRVLRGAASR